MNRVAKLALLSVLALASCQLTVSASPSVATSPSSPPASPIEGVVTSVESGGLNEVASFDLRTADGSTWTFEIGELENAAEFPPGHLREHMATSTPVRVTFEVDGDRLLVTRLEDAD